MKITSAFAGAALAAAFCVTLSVFLALTPLRDIGLVALGVPLGLFGESIALRCARLPVKTAGSAFLSACALIDAARTREAAIVARIAAAAAVATAALLAVAGPSYAAQAVAAAPPAANVVSIPWGDWLASLAMASGGLFTLIASYALRGAPAALRAYLTNDAIAKAAHYVIATEVGLVQGKTVEIGVANDLIFTIASRLVDSEPKIAKWAGARLEPLIVAELSRLGLIPPEADAAALGLTAGT